MKSGPISAAVETLRKVVSTWNADWAATARDRRVTLTLSVALASLISSSVVALTMSGLEGGSVGEILGALVGAASALLASVWYDNHKRARDEVQQIEVVSDELRSLITAVEELINLIANGKQDDKRIDEFFHEIVEMFDTGRLVVIHLQELKNAQAIRHLGALRAIYALGYMVEFYSKEDRKLSESTFLYQPRSHEHIEAVEENLKQLSYQLKSLSSELREEVVR